MTHSHSAKTPLLTRLVEVFLRGDVAILLSILSLLLGVAALHLTPREEDPQIVVPMADVFISAPGLSAEEVERQVGTRLEKLLYQIDGVEYVYSMSQPERCIVTVRFYVGEDRVESLVKLYNKINSNIDQVPPAVTRWVVKPIEIDDVPIVNITLWSDRTALYGDHELRRIAEELQLELKQIRDTNRVRVVGGRPQRIRVELDPERLAARQTSALQILDALQASNVNYRTRGFEQQNQQFNVEVGTFLGDVEELQDVVIQVKDGRPVYLRDVAEVLEGPAEVESYSWIGFGPAAESRTESMEFFPAVHVAVAKRKGTNAVWVADAVEQRMEALSQTHLPAGVYYRITRNYGETANDKVNELVEALAVAVLTVIGLIGLTLGWRPALVIALAIPVCYSLALFVNLMAGYTINRVTLFALILALGLLVDDPITDVENIARYFTMRVLPARESVLRAVQEVRPALLLSTLAIIVSFLPLAFITGMMGPYMAPMALNVPLTVTFSTVVAFTITPWLAMVALRKLVETGKAGEKPYELREQPLYRFYRRVLTPILNQRWRSWTLLGLVLLLLLGALTLPLFRTIPLKMLPYDNKNEFQLVIDMPEGTTLEATDGVARRLGIYLSRVAEVRDYEVYVGLASPMDFNGLVRHYYLRQGPHVADIRVNLAPKDKRAHQSHEIILRIRQDVTRLAQELGANVKLVEVPPGPPVLATVTAEVYAPEGAAYEEQIAVARRLEERLRQEPKVVDVDISAQEEQIQWVFETDKQKAALSSISTADVGKTVQMALDGLPATVLHRPKEVDPLWVELRLPRAQRSAINDLEKLYIVGQQGELVQLGSLGSFRQEREDQTIYHKNLERVVYVYAEVAGVPPADAIIDMQLDRQTGEEKEETATPRPLSERTWFSPGGGEPWSVPAGYRIEWAGEGEWNITLDVFRDLGLAFAAALVGIFIILMFQTGSRILPLIIMLAIPLTLIGIMPGFWLLNIMAGQAIGGYPNPIYFTATAMIGMIALAGIVVRNSVVLIDFIRYAQEEGHELLEAIIRSTAIRTRPILLTAATTLLGNWVITLDPIFSGLAWAIIFGIVTSTLFTLLVIPIVYSLVFGTVAEGRLVAKSSFSGA